LANVLTGEVDARGRGARAETQEVMYRYYFDVLGMEAACCTVFAHNAAILKVTNGGGWELTDTTYKPAAGGGAPIELRSFRLQRETWARKAGEKSAQGRREA
jgi:hypothetical protein